jgi:hypothetical protein
MTRSLRLVMMIAATLFVSLEVAARPEIPFTNDEVETDSPHLSETDTYIDINTGKSFKVIYDALNDTYNRDDLFPMDVYVNTRTNDTFWQAEAVLVNYALLQDVQAIYKVDPMKVKRDGNGYRLRWDVAQLQKKQRPAAKGSQVKTKVAETKVKINDQEMKMKVETQPGEQKLTESN